MGRMGRQEPGCESRSRHSSDLCTQLAMDGAPKSSVKELTVLDKAVSAALSSDGASRGDVIFSMHLRFCVSFFMVVS